MNDVNLFIAGTGMELGELLYIANGERMQRIKSQFLPQKLLQSYFEDFYSLNPITENKANQIKSQILP